MYMYYTEDTEQVISKWRIEVRTENVLYNVNKKRL